MEQELFPTQTHRFSRRDLSLGKPISCRDGDTGNRYSLPAKNAETLVLDHLGTTETLTFNSGQGHLSVLRIAKEVAHCAKSNLVSGQDQTRVVFNNLENDVLQGRFGDINLHVAYPQVCHRSLAV
ncbi:hypothetical protein D3C84_688990 [compost metagenome]